MRRKSNTTSRKNKKQQMRVTSDLALAGYDVTALFDRLPIGLGILNKRTFVDVNKCLCRMVGYTKKELIGKDIRILYATDGEYRRVGSEYRKMLTRKEVTLEATWQTKKGKVIDIIIRGTRFVKGKLPNVVLFNVTDVTEKRKAEQALRESESRLVSIFRVAPMGIGLMVNRFFYQVNDTFCAIVGYSREELIGKSARLIYPTDDEFERVGREKYQQIRKCGTGTLESQFRRKDGSVIDVLLSSTPLDNQNLSLGITFTTLDITDQKRALEKLRRSEEEKSLIFENMVNGFVLGEVSYGDRGYAFDFRFLQVNPSFIALTGTDTMIGKLWGEVFFSADRQLLDAFTLVVETGSPKRFVYYYDPKRQWWDIVAFKVKDNQFACIVMDITDRKMIEEEKERLIKELKNKNRELERFTYTVSHDLKGPLITIEGFAAKLAEDIADNDSTLVNRDIEFIRDAGNKMKELLDGVLELSRVGRIMGEPGNVSLHEIIADVITINAGLIEEAKADIAIGQGLPYVRCDRQRIFQVVQNLLDNAIKHTGEQAVPKIEIGVASQHSDDSYVAVFFRDNGIGIDPSYHDKIFGLFNKINTKTSGTGVGLAVAKRIIDVHGGKIWVESGGQGGGSVFYFTLPYAEEKDI